MQKALFRDGELSYDYLSLPLEPKCPVLFSVDRVLRCPSLAGFICNRHKRFDFVKPDCYSQGLAYLVP